eukprot:TRINITY_DN2152_c0_g1_i2.p1 TRINITY_DN2152_c0_g1~~TRINITY_DN2152_c0_g1_i2.p1  ORF type:complete len:209 (+),score=9.60 TRINITY_DN2152_c0_g1_i2:51-677(+)
MSCPVTGCVKRNACAHCRRWKVKCTGGIPCERCYRLGHECELATPRRRAITTIDDLKEVHGIKTTEQLRRFLKNTPPPYDEGFASSTGYDCDGSRICTLLGDDVGILPQLVVDETRLVDELPFPALMHQRTAAGVVFAKVNAEAAALLGASPAELEMAMLARKLAFWTERIAPADIESALALFGGALLSASKMQFNAHIHNQMGMMCC